MAEGSEKLELDLVRSRGAPVGIGGWVLWKASPWKDSLGSANALLLLVGGASVTVWLHKHSMLLKADLSRIGRVEHLQPGCEHRES